MIAGSDSVFSVHCFDHCGSQEALVLGAGSALLVRLASFFAGSKMALRFPGFAFLGHTVRSPLTIHINVTNQSLDLQKELVNLF